MAKSKKKPVAKKKAATSAKKPTAKSAKKSAAKKPAGKVAKKAAAKPVKKAAAPKKTTPAKSAATLNKPTPKAPSKALSENLMPLDDRVLIEPEGKAEKTAGGLFIPDSVQERPQQGRVLAVGKGGRTKKGQLRPLDVKVGDQVLYGQFTGMPLQLSGRELLLLREEDILGVVK